MNQQSFLTINKSILILCLFLIGTTHASADLVLTESFLIGGSDYDEGLSVQQTTDGGFVIAGATSSSDGNFSDSGYWGATDAFIAKVDAEGNKEWVRCVGGLGSDYASSVQQTDDGGFSIIGYTASSDGNFTNSGYHGDYDAFVARIDPAGNLEWVRCIGGSGGDIGIAIQPTPDEGYIIAGYSSSIDGNFTEANHHGGSSDAFLAKLDPTGEVEWIRCVGGTGDNEYGHAVQLSADGGYILGGQAASSDGDFAGSGYHHSPYPSIDTGDGFLAKINSTGTVEWTHCFGGSLNDYITDFEQMDDGWFVVSGSTTSSDGDLLGAGYHAEWDTYIAKVNANGTVSWARCIGSTGNEQGLSSTQTIEGDIIVSGFVTPYIATLDGDFADTGYHGGGSDTFLAYVTTSGILEWVRCIGGSGGDNGQAVERTDNRVMLVGHTSSTDGDFIGTMLHGVIDVFVVTLVNPIPAIAIEKTVSVDGGNTFLDADIAPGPSVFVGNPVQWHYNITNIGNVPLTGITVTDDQGVTVTLPKTILDPGESMIGTASDTAIAGQYANTGFVNSTYADNFCTDVDTAHYFGLIPPPVADFSGNPTTGDAPLSVSFIDISTGSPAGWAWFFGDETYNASWIQVTGNAPWSARCGHSSVVMPDGSIVLMGGLASEGWKNDVWRSIDNGTSWTQMTANAQWSPRPYPNGVALPDGSIVIMGGSNGLNDVWRSTDNGATWAQMTANAEWSARYYQSSVALPDGSIVMMGGMNNTLIWSDVWRSTDKGATWTQMTANAPWEARSQHASVALSDGSIILMGGGATSGWKNDVWRSTDKGATWTLINANADWALSQRFSCVALPDDSIVIMGGSDTSGVYLNDIWLSTDKGITWKKVNEHPGWTPRTFHSSVAFPDGNIILMGGNDCVPDYVYSYKNDVWRLITAGSSDQNPSHTYTEPGIYQVTLQAFNNGGYNSTRKSEYITVNASMTVFGNATINGIPAPPGSEVTASVLGFNQSIIIHQEGWYGESEIGKGLVIRGPIPSGSIVTFTINGIQARVGVKNPDGTTTWLDTVFPFFPNSCFHLDLDAIGPVNPSPTISVVSPNGGEEWKQGSTQALRWNYTGDPGSSVKIEVIKGSAVRVIAPSTPIGLDGSGSFNFTFPFSAPLGSDYQIRVTSINNTTYTDTSDAPFSIIPPITVVSPNGGEEWEQGSTQTIQWGYIGNPGPTVKVEALRGDTVLAVISQGTPVGIGGSGSMNLTLPFNTPLGTEYRIRVSSTSNPLYTDTSDTYFSVIPNTSATAESYVFDLQWGSEGSGDGQFQFRGPVGIAVDSAGNIYVGDTNNQRIQKFTANGTFITKWGSKGPGDGQFNNPFGVAVDGAGNVYVSDYNRIQKFTANGTFITKWGSSGTGDGQFGSENVAVDGAGNVYVADSTNNRIQKFTANGTFITKWGSYGTGDGQFIGPSSVAVDGAGNVYVGEWGNPRIQKFNSTGAFITKWGSEGSGNGQFNPPLYVAVDSAGNIYVGDTNNHRIQKFTANGSFITKWGSYGTGDGQFWCPIGIAVDNEGNVYVGEWGNNRIQKFRFIPLSVLSITLPNGGENYVQGSTHTIQWNYTGNPGPTVKIEALRGESVLATVATNYPIGSGGSGSFNLTFPYNTPLGSDYRIRVTSTSNPAWTDTSESQFTVSPAITVTTPDGGENYSIGSILPMSWTYSGSPGPMVNIHVIKGTTVLKTLTGIPIGSGGSGSLNVTIPPSTPSGSDYTIRVSSATYPPCFDASNGMFTISLI